MTKTLAEENQRFRIWRISFQRFNLRKKSFCNWLKAKKMLKSLTSGKKRKPSSGKHLSFAQHCRWVHR